ncbi:DUF5011 domain-containing protein [Akkermansiaceae bacterium]|nr:DUF5011 domain-containing protein [Akkermansiaceae bacterium]
MPIGFTFTYGGVGYTTCQMSTNGVLFFTNPTSQFSNTALTSITNSQGIYPLWDDLYVGPSGNPIPSTAVYATTGAPGSRIFVMQWTNWYSFGESFEVGTFNVVLYEGSNKIDIYYRNMLGASAQRGYGASATIGLVSSGGYVNQYSLNSPVATEGRLLTYTPAAGGNTPYSLSVQDVTPATAAAIPTYFLFAVTNPKQPLNLSANPGSPNATSATLTWSLGNNGVDPSNFTIRYSTSPSMAGFIETSAIAAPGQPYVLTGLTQGVTYYWQVVSRNATNYSTSTTSTFVQTPNTPPVAFAGSFTTQLDTSYSGTLVATDADNSPPSSGLIYSITTPPAHGSAVITNSATGAFTYTPTTGVSGATSFGFRAFDGTAFSNEAFISLNVISNLPPVVTLNGPSSVTLECFVDFYTELGATATDPEDGSRPVVISGTVDRTKVGVYTRTYTATDSEGATGTATRTINVVDTLPPVISAPSGILVPSAIGGLSERIFYSPTITASDRAQGNVAVHPYRTRRAPGSRSARPPSPAPPPTSTATPRRPHSMSSSSSCRNRPAPATWMSSASAAMLCLREPPVRSSTSTTPSSTTPAT